MINKGVALTALAISIWWGTMTLFIVWLKKNSSEDE